jgi:hypothetical protein
MHTAKKAFAVHIHTAKVALLCTARLGQFCCSIFAVRGEVEVHGKEETLPCGMGPEHTAKPAARQTLKAHGNHTRTATLSQRTAKPVRTAKAFAVPLPRGARQRRLCRAVHCRAFFAVQARSAKALPSVFGPLPCVLAARQSPVLP